MPLHFPSFGIAAAATPPNQPTYKLYTFCFCYRSIGAAVIFFWRLLDRCGRWHAVEEHNQIDICKCKFSKHLAFCGKCCAPHNFYRFCFAHLLLKLRLHIHFSCTRTTLSAKNTDNNYYNKMVERKWEKRHVVVRWMIVIWLITGTHKWSDWDASEWMQWLWSLNTVRVLWCTIHKYNLSFYFISQLWCI